MAVAFLARSPTTRFGIPLVTSAVQVSVTETVCTVEAESVYFRLSVAVAAALVVVQLIVPVKRYSAVVPPTVTIVVSVMAATWEVCVALKTFGGEGVVQVGIAFAPADVSTCPL